MKKYITLLLALFSINIKRNLENRWNAGGTSFAFMISLLLNIIFIEVLFQKTNSIYGWEKYQVFFISGLARLLVSLSSLLFFRGLAFIPQYINKGELDLMLSKPINLQFYITFRYNRFLETINAIGGIILIIYSLEFAPNTSSFFQWAILILAVSFGLVIFYSIYFILATFSIWLKRFASLPNLYRMMNDTLSVPTDILGPKISTVLTVILPIAFVVTIPAKIFFSKASYDFLIVEFLVALLCFTISVWFWNYSLRHYTSASS